MLHIQIPSCSQNLIMWFFLPICIISMILTLSIWVSSPAGYTATNIRKCNCHPKVKSRKQAMCLASLNVNWLIGVMELTFVQMQRWAVWLFNTQFLQYLILNIYRQIINAALCVYIQTVSKVISFNILGFELWQIPPIPICISNLKNITVTS